MIKNDNINKKENIMKIIEKLEELKNKGITNVQTYHISGRRLSHGKIEDVIKDYIKNEHTDDEVVNERYIGVRDDDNTKWVELTVE